jgi:hypothetical protein
MGDTIMTGDTHDKLVHAYNRMLERIKAALEHAENDTLPSLQHSLEAARQKAVELGELTREEAEKISAYLKRDLQDAVHHAKTTGKELSEWLRFDLGLIEQRALDAFSNIVQRAKQELDKLGLQPKQTKANPTEHWHSGEITGVGTLYCTACGAAQHFHATSTIPPCPKCHATMFRRGPADS